MAVFFAEDFTSVSARQRRVRAGKLAVVARGVWTDQVNRPVEDVVADHWRAIVGRLLPGSVITFRSGLAMRPENGMLFVAHPRESELTLPGLTVYPDGQRDPRHDDDVPLDSDGRLFAASTARALVDNAETRGRPSKVRRRLTRDELHDHLARIVATYSRQQVDQILAKVDQDANRRAAATIRVFAEAARGNTTVQTGSQALAAAQRREPYDARRIALFGQIMGALDRLPLIQRYLTEPQRSQLAPFYEAYFSNYIEGSTLTLQEAEQVVFDRKEVGKPGDEHDISATWRIVNDVDEMSRDFATAGEFMETLRDRHATMMVAHPRTLPGQWKQIANRAGAVEFVRPEHVVGTLRAGWDTGQKLHDPFKRACYMMFLVSEVHPFVDGNGRSARVAMNAELVRHGLHRIVIPTILRNSYMAGLNRTTHGHGPEGLYRVLDRAQQWTAVGEFSTLDDSHRYLRATNALWDSGAADHQGVYLIVPRLGEVFDLADQPYPDADN